MSLDAYFSFLKGRNDKAKRLAFEAAESDARDGLLAGCLSTAIFVFCWLALDSVIDIITFSFFGALK